MPDNPEKTRKPGRSLQRTMILYFLLIGFASLLVGVEFIVDTHSRSLKQTLSLNFEKHSRQEISAEAVFHPIERLRNKAILIVGIIMVVMLIVLTMFIKNITEPLQHMIEVSRDITAGNLSRTVKVDARNELAELSNVINEMSSNLQEIILLSQHICASGHAFLAEAAPVMKSAQLPIETASRLRAEIDRFEADLGTMDEVVEEFKFYSLETPGKC